jgi:hypothetical protein
METGTSPREQIPPTKFSFSSPEQFWRPGSVRFPSVAFPEILHRESLLMDVIPDNLCYLGFLSDGYPPETAGMTEGSRHFRRQVNLGQTMVKSPAYEEC